MIRSPKTLLSTISQVPIQDFCRINPYPIRVHPQLEDIAVDHIDSLRTGSQPVVDGDGRLIGVLSELDLGRSITRAERGGHSLDEFKFTRLKVTSACTEILWPLTPDTPAWILIETFRKGTRRVHLTDDAQQPYGYVDALDVVDAFLKVAPEFADETTVGDIMEHSRGGASSLTIYGAYPLVEVLKDTESNRRFVILFALGRVCRQINVLDIISAMARVDSEQNGSAEETASEKSGAKLHSIRPRLLHARCTDDPNWADRKPIKALLAETPIREVLEPLRIANEFVVIHEGDPGIERTFPLEVTGVSMDVVRGWIDSFRVFRHMIKALHRTIA